MSDHLLRFRYEDQDYEIEARDITVARLRAGKSWFGKEYGAYLPFINLLMQFDADAIAMAIWIGKTKAGQSCPEPRQIDFSPSDLIDMQADPEPEVDELEKSPTKRGRGTPTPD
jgi:hypothetical protein